MDGNRFNKPKASNLADQFGMLLHDEVVTWQNYLRLANPHKIVILGAGRGTATLAIFEMAYPCEVYSVDINESGPFGGLKFEQAIIAKSSYPLRSQQHFQVMSDSAEFAKHIEGQVDCVFVDADHSYESAKADIEAWLPKIKEGGTMWVHDYDVETQCNQIEYDPPIPWRYPAPGVDRAVEELLLGKYEMIDRYMSLAGWRIE